MARTPMVTAALGYPRRVVGQLSRSRFVRSVVTVAAGTAGAQALNMAFAPLVTRIYGPEAFGLLGTFTAIIAVTIPLAALAYPVAIVLPRGDGDALGLVKLSLVLSFVVALFAAAALWVGGDWLFSTLGAESVAGYLLLIPAAMLFVAWMQTAQQWSIRKKEFGVVARSAVAHSLITNGAKIGIGCLHPLAAVLIVVTTLGHALHAALLFLGVRRKYCVGVAEAENRARTPLKVLARRHRDFPLYRAPQNFINAASQSLPVLILAAFFGPEPAGFYTLAKMVMGMPSALLGKAVMDVFYPRITEAAHNSENLLRYIAWATGALLAVGMMPFGLVMLLGPWLFSLVFGEGWAMAGEYARWLALWMLTAFINQPSVATIPVLSIQRGFLVYEVVSVTARVLAIILGVKFFQSDVVAVALFAAVGVVLNLFLIAWVLWTAYNHEDSRLH